MYEKVLDKLEITTKAQFTIEDLKAEKARLEGILTHAEEQYQRHLEVYGGQLAIINTHLAEAEKLGLVSTEV